MEPSTGKNYFLIGGILAIALIVIAGAVLVMSQQQAQPTPLPPVVQPSTPASRPTPPPPPRIEETKPPATEEGAIMEKKEVVVEFTGTGFTPATLTVKKGTTVKFVNKSSATMWVASVVHPTHQLLPGFDQLSTGDTYFYTFAKVGSWGYHNHRPLVAGGKVVVTE